MQSVLSLFIGNPMEATDGQLGKVEEFYFDDQAWIIVYLVVKTGNWLSGRKVLISPVALIRGVDHPGTFPVNLTKEQIKNSPDIDTDLPVSRQQEIALHQYYPWQSYWGTGFYEGGLWGIVTPPVEDRVPVKVAVGGIHLRSTQAVTGYHIQTTDGELGYLKDFIFDDQTWHIEFLVIELHSWLSGKKVMIARKHAKEIQWTTSKVLIDLSKQALENSQPYEEQVYPQEEKVDTVFDPNMHLK
jgi:uncharacterized protein YrrD